MRILAIETSGNSGSAAVLDGPSLIAEESFERGMTRGTSLAPTARQLILDAGWSPKEIDAVAVSLGPGSYTGLRIGLAFAKTFAWATQSRLIGVPTFLALAHNVEATHVATLHNARMKQIAAQRFERSGDVVEAQTELFVGPAEEWIPPQPKGTVFLGDGVATCDELVTSSGFAIADESLWIPRASTIGTLGYHRLEIGDNDDLSTLVPMYARDSIPTPAKRK